MHEHGSTGSTTTLMSVRRALVVGLVVAAALVAVRAVGGVAPALAHVCADYPNQAAAQCAHDTVDADKDGIYCESVPCPCLKPGKDDGPIGQPPAPGTLGPSVTLGPVRKRSGCRVRGPLPDPGCTPGARFAKVTTARVCRSGYAKSVRSVSASTKNAMYAAYGMSTHFNGDNGEVDHLVSLELGGSNSRANLFPEAATPRPGSHEKDRLENELHHEVCAGTITLRRAQLLIARDWLSAYRARFR
jgi:hypothetical protein